LYLLLAPLPGVLYLAIVLALTLLGILWCGRAARDLGVHDHPAIVWDEVVGFLITMALAPEG
jgi:phosphatidylglycerophosphatase A